MPLDFGTEEEIAEDKYKASATGSLRTNVGKIDPTHLAPDFIMEMAKVLSANEHKYPKFNYAKGQEYSMTMASLLRHSLNLLNGEDIDPTDGCHNAAKIAVNAMIVWCTYKYHVKNYPQLDDRFKKVLGVE